jgi:hypothetical protein
MAPAYRIRYKFRKKMYISADQPFIPGWWYPGLSYGKSFHLFVRFGKLGYLHQRYGIAGIHGVHLPGYRGHTIETDDPNRGHQKGNNDENPDKFRTDLQIVKEPDRFYTILGIVPR